MGNKYKKNSEKMYFFQGYLFVALIVNLLFTTSVFASSIEKVLSKADEMCSVTWTPTVSFSTWQSSKGINNTVKDINGTSTGTKFLTGHTYQGIPYTMYTGSWNGINRNRLDEDEWMTFLKSHSSVSDYSGYVDSVRTNSCKIGVDCSGLVQRALQAAGCTGVSGLNTTDLANGKFNNVFTALGSFNELQPGDILNKGGSHMVLVKSVSGNNLVVYESNASYSKCVMMDRTKAYYNSYTAYRYKDWESSHNPTPGYVGYSVGNAKSPSSFWWDRGENATKYILKIWNGTLWVGDPCKWIETSDLSCQVSLPAGHYEAYVDYCNDSGGYKISNNTISFDVPNVYSLDLNGLLDDNQYGDLGSYGTADVYINGELVKKGVNDYYDYLPDGTSFEFTNFKANTGYIYSGFSGTLKGVISGQDIVLNAIFYRLGQELSSGGERVIPPGDYLIAAAGTEDKSTFYYLDIEGTAQPASNGTNVSLCGPLSKNPPSYEIWTLSYKDGFYTIKQKGTDVCLDVADGSRINRANVWVCADNGSSAQKWVISYNGTDGYRIQAKCSGFSLDIDDGKISNGVNVQQWENNSSKAQSWMFIPYQPPRTIPDGRYILLSEIDETYELDVSGDTGDVENGVNVQIWKDTAQSQYNSFDIKQQSDGYYIFTHVASGKELSSLGGTSAAGQNIGLYDSNGHPAHEWAITNDGDNDGYVLRTKCSGMAMDVENGIAADGTNVRQLPYNGTKAQTWKFVKAEYTITFDPNGGTTNWSEKTKNYNESAWLWRAYSPKRTGYEFLGWTEEGRDSTRVDYVQGSYYEKNADVTLYAVWKKLEPDMILPANLKTIEEEAFTGGTFTYVQIPEGTKAIENRAFADCSNMKMIIIPESVVDISEKAFEGVDGLTILGKDGSYAEYYAQKNGYAFAIE